MKNTDNRDLLLIILASILLFFGIVGNHIYKIWSTW